MSTEPPVSGLELHPEHLSLNGNHTDLIAQLAEEVGFLSGVLMSLDLNSDDRSAIRQQVLEHWRELAAGRREVNAKKRDEAGVLR